MIDFHTHILPGIDDGSHDVRESLFLLEREREQGVKKIVATHHFYAQKDTVAHFLECRQNAYQELAGHLQGQDKEVPILAGAEVYYFPGIGEAKQLVDLCVEESSVLLLELPFVPWTEGIYNDVKKIIEKQKITVLLAHVERYYEFQKDKKIWNRIFELPLYAQINTGGMGRRKKRRFVEQFMKTNVPVVLGSDCHNRKDRLPNMQEGRACIKALCGEKAVEEIDRTGERLFQQHE